MSYMDYMKNEKSVNTKLLSQSLEKCLHHEDDVV